jgi:signal transduction histidine kinase
LKDFISLASHDLRGPLGKIALFGSRLVKKADNLEPESKEYLLRMQKTALRAQDLVDDLQVFSQASVQGGPFRKICLATVLKEVIADLDLLPPKNDRQILIGPLPTIEGNPIQLEQLFKNLLSNAIKFYDEGTPPKIEVTSHPCKSGGWEISIKDKGIGFNEKYTERIFRPFERLNGKSAYEGTGMGLAICQKIVENHGGTIQVQSQPGKGSCFTVILPATHKKTL